MVISNKQAKRDILPIGTTINIILLLLIIMMAKTAFAQDAAILNIEGVVYDNQNQPLPAVHVLSLDPLHGSMTDEQGHFTIPVAANGQLVISYVGFKTDTIVVRNDDDIVIHLEERKQLGEFVVQGRKRSMDIDMLATAKTEQFNENEFLKAACCNLSESFETIPSVDVGFTDAVSGYKQIKMLGLAGANTAYTRENIPNIRGMASITGLTFIPGAWVSSMQLSKGAGSVVNGYEGTAGQINIELKKPFEEKAPMLFLNGYQSIQGRSEGNLVYNHQFNPHLSTNLLVHGSSNWLKNDENEDGFLDNPLGKVLTAANRWFLFTDRGFELQAGVKGVYSDNTGGQTEYPAKAPEIQTGFWGYRQKLKRVEGWAKIGKVFPEKKWKSMGLQLSGSYHLQNSQYGRRRYNGEQKSLYANYIYQSILGNTNHGIKAGASIAWDQYQEMFTGDRYDYQEVVPGVFTEYSYNYLTKLNIVAGLRADYDNLSGFFVTPRLHIRYAPKENTVIRASAGRAQRTVNVFSENMGYLASSRRFILSNPKEAYPFKPEIAWNVGVNLTQNFILNYRDGSFSMDYYYTDFTHQVMVDIENPELVRIYNLEGKSFAHSFQAQLDYEPVRKLDLRLAYRYFNVQADYDGTRLEKPFLAAHRAFLNAAYHTNSNWKFDYTLQWTGRQRVPAHFLNDQLITTSYAPSFLLMNAQISKSWKDSKYEVYLGAENLTNYMQPNLILNADNPFGKHFDAAMVWGPGMGRNIYLGVRLKIH